MNNSLSARQKDLLIELLQNARFSVLGKGTPELYEEYLELTVKVKLLLNLD